VPLNPSKIKVLIADDSAFMRKVLTDIFNKDPRLEVIATARNGQEACEKVQTLNPDVLTLDVEMPVMDGLTALEKIMQINPMPVVMLSALTQAGARSTMDALSKGAVDFIAKPGGSISVNINDAAEEIISKVKMAAQVNTKRLRPARSQPLQETPAKTRPAAPQSAVTPGPNPAPQSAVTPGPKPAPQSAVTPGPKPAPSGPAGFSGSRLRKLPIVAVGTSTGGPKALFEMMQGLPGNLGAGVLIVQHMPPGFTKSLAQRLDSICSLTVKEAEDGEEIKKNYAYIAPGDHHMELKEGRGSLFILLHQKPPVNGHRPSVDVLMDSLATYQGHRVGVIMTGMGSDGAKGITALHRNGVTTIGESAETCVVYGMPKSAFQMGGIDHEIPLGKIAGMIVQAIAKE
jgi:two-component system chemotaxis response regulator CheB